jgi:hypothetical protein
MIARSYLLQSEYSGIKETTLYILELGLELRGAVMPKMNGMKPNSKRVTYSRLLEVIFNEALVQPILS